MNFDSDSGRARLLPSLADPTRVRLRRSVALPVAFVLLLCATGCGSYSGASPRTYEYAKALYSICNRRADDKLAEVASRIEADAASGEISSSEASWLRGIVADAQGGDWQGAMREARDLMVDQTHRL